MIGDYLIFNIPSIILFALCLVVLILDIIFKKFYLKIIFGLIATAFIIISILLGASFQEVLIAILILLVTTLFSFYPPKRKENV